MWQKAKTLKRIGDRPSATSDPETRWLEPGAPVWVLAERPQPRSPEGFRTDTNQYRTNLFSLRYGCRALNADKIELLAEFSEDVPMEEFEEWFELHYRGDK